MADDEEPWEVAELIAALDPGIAGRLLAKHPATTGWCRSCQMNAPCSARAIAEAAEAAEAAWQRGVAARPARSGTGDALTDDTRSTRISAGRACAPGPRSTARRR